jgi:hypothetical protein
VDSWILIKTAPKDGTRALLFRPTLCGTADIVIGSWNGDLLHSHSQPYWSHDAEHELGTKEARRSQASHSIQLPIDPIDHEFPVVEVERVPTPLLTRVENHRFHQRRTWASCF